MRVDSNIRYVEKERERERDLKRLFPPSTKGAQQDYALKTADVRTHTVLPEEMEQHRWCASDATGRKTNRKTKENKTKQKQKHNCWANEWV